ncbi:twitchin-like [Gigantopelta aegis]|uniref:twitchin-like n=1 Tax=Gigantopelta aegis TaxID=1735272 RepID=UPI001B887D6C|nr:twitchin-like [Gigantopelta aegis]
MSSLGNFRSDSLLLGYDARGPDSVTLNPSPPGSVAEGDSLTVTCSAAGCKPPCSYSWTLRNQMISSTSLLKLTNINRSQTGNVWSRQCPTEHHFSTDSKGSNPGPDIKLLNNSQTLCEVTNSKQSEYTWNEAGCLDTGYYTCEAGNNIKSAVSESVQLVVRCSPRLDHRVPFQKQFAAAVGGDVTLKISVIANPTPTFTWYKLTDGNKNRLGSGDSSTTDVSSVGKLTLTNVQQGNIGTYQVVVSNGAKNTDLVKNLTLDVAGPPNIPMNVTAWSNGSHSVSVSWIETFNGGSIQTFLIQYRADTTSQWTNLTAEFPEKVLHTNHTAVISNLQPGTRYLVKVLAYNKYGYKGFTEEQEALTLIAGPPNIPMNVTAWSNGPHSVSVSWIEALNGGSEQTFVVQYRADTISRWTNLAEVILEKGLHTNHTAVISNLQPETRYLVKVLAYNRYGYKGFTKEQEALTLIAGESLVPASSNKVTGEGIAVGVVIGIAVATVVVTVTVFILWRRGYVCASLKSDGKQSEARVHQHVSLDDRMHGHGNGKFILL